MASTRREEPPLPEVEELGEEPELAEQADVLKLKVELEILKHELGGLQKMMSVARGGAEKCQQGVPMQVAALSGEEMEPEQLASCSAPASSQGQQPPTEVSALPTSIGEAAAESEQAPRRWGRRLRKRSTQIDVGAVAATKLDNGQDILSQFMGSVIDSGKSRKCEETVTDTPSDGGAPWKRTRSFALAARGGA